MFLRSRPRACVQYSYSTAYWPGVCEFEGMPPTAATASLTAPQKMTSCFTVTITTVGDEMNHPPIVTQPTGDDDEIFLNPINLRCVLQPFFLSLLDGKSAPIG